MEICRKAALSRHLKRMRSACPAGTYDFAPETWEHPNEMEAFRKHCKAHPGGSYIVKPAAGAMGRGIYLTRGPDGIDHKHESAMVVQRYVSRPLLVDGYKFDLRVYALVTCVEPLTVYVYEEGIARFATTRYQKPTAANLHSKTMHLTNYSLNKHSADFVHTETDDEGTKRALSALWKDLRAKGHDVDALWTRLERLVDRTIGAMRHAVRDAAVANRAHPEMCFQGAFCTLVPIRPRSRGERRFLRTFPGVSLRPPVAFNPRPRRLSTPTDAFQLHPDVRSYGTTQSRSSR